MSKVCYYRVVTVYDGYNIEYSYDKILWHKCMMSMQAFGVHCGHLPYWYKTLFFAKRRVRKFIKRDAEEAALLDYKTSFVPKVVYGPYP